MDHYEVGIDEISQGCQTSPFILPALSDGEHNITVKAFDKLWNQATGLVKVYSDRTPPLQFTPTVEPSGWINSSPRIKFETTDDTSGVDRYEVAVDGGAFSCQTSPFTAPILSDGQHNITVRAYDKAGNFVSGWVMVYLDSSQPFNFSIASDFPNWTDKEFNITFQALDNSSNIDHFEVKLPGGNFTVQTSPYELPMLPDGRHIIMIRVYDKALNYVEASIEVFIDKTPPAAFAPLADPTNWTNKDPKINFTTIDNTSGISRYEVSIDNGSLSTVISPYTVPNVSDGEHQVTIRAYDRAGNHIDGVVRVYVDKTSPVQPTLKINEGEKSTSKRRVVVSILASDATSGMDSIAFSNDGVFFGGWEPFNSTFDWNLTKEIGKKTIYVKVKDKAGNEATAVSASITYSVPAVESRFDLTLLLLALVILVVVAIGIWRWRASKKPKDEEIPPEVKEAPPGAKEEIAPSQEPALKPGPVVAKEPPVIPKIITIEEKAIAPKTPVTFAPKEPASKPPERPKVPAPVSTPVPKAPPPAVVAKAPRPPVAPKSPTATPMAIAPEGFAVEDIFLMYQDGRLIQHTTRRLKADMDVDIMTSMLKAVQEFVKESIGMETGTELGSMEYGDNKIMLEKGKYTILAAVINGAEPGGFRDEMKSVVRNIESEFSSVLPDWNGVTARMAGAKRFMTQLGAFAPGAAAAAGTAPGEVNLKAEVEFYQGFVRLKVAVKNSMPTAILGAEFKLIYNRDALRLDAIEPENLKRGEDAVLGVVEPNEKKTVAFYLDPQICTESYVEGILSFKDAHGKLMTLMMPRKLASVVCPILFTDENINTAMLKRMAVDELNHKDTKVFSIPSGITSQKAYEVAKAAVQHHDVRQVREFVEKDPFIGEAWYYGKAKGREDRIVIRTRALADRSLLEFFVASNSVLMLTGMLAELKTDLNKELDSRNVRAGMRQVTSQKEVDAVGAIKTLLEKASGSEIDAGETDTKN